MRQRREDEEGYSIIAGLQQEGAQAPLLPAGKPSLWRHAVNVFKSWIG